MAALSLLRQGHPLASAARQREVLEGEDQVQIPTFQSMLTANGIVPLQSGDLKTLQVNIGKLCNQTCRHCHVDAGPDRRELMTRENFLHCLRLLTNSTIETVDITGGAPEMNCGASPPAMSCPARLRTDSRI